MLRNELYRGVRVWNRTVKTRNPETGRKVSKNRPKEEWERVDVPKLRIVPEELWNAVQARIKQVNQKLGAARLGGMNRTVGSRSYLFSGLLVCGECSSTPGGAGSAPERSLRNNSERSGKAKA